MRRVCGLWLTGFIPYLQTVPVDYLQETLAADRSVSLKITAVHIPQFHTAYTGIFCTDAFYVFQNKRLLSDFLEDICLVMFILSLLAYAKQCAKSLDSIAFGILCVQVTHCLAPAFFLMRMPNLASATLMSSS